MKHHRRVSVFAIGLVVLATVACEGPEVAPSTSEVRSDNGLRLNGLRLNGLRLNGLRLNGAFVDWFNNQDGGDIAMHDNLMNYVIACALPAGQSTSFDDSHGVTHVWTGGLGLAPAWLDGPASETDTQWVTACLMAHANSATPAPKHIQISVRGNAPALATTAIEVDTVKTFDGVYFGDGFRDGGGYFVCSATTTPPAANYVESLLKDWGRQCFYKGDGCGVFTVVNCATACQVPAAGSSYMFGPTCTANGKSYQAIDAYVPGFKRARDFTRSSGVGTVACVNCVDNLALSGLSSSTTSARVPAVVKSTGSYLMDVRYANGSTVTQYLKIQIDSTTVMNGASDKWSFPPTGGSDTWAQVSIPASIAANATLWLKGTGTTGPRVDSVSLRLP